VTTILDPARLPQASPGPAAFPWDDLRDALKRLGTTVRGGGELYDQWSRTGDGGDG
jgi:hypothetical protein